MQFNSGDEYNYTEPFVSKNSDRTGALSLSDVKPGSRCVVHSVTASSPELKHKLLTMGVIVGATLEVVSVAPLGDPITVKTLGYKLSLRKSEALGVLVSIVS